MPLVIAALRWAMLPAIIAAPQAPRLPICRLSISLQPSIDDSTHVADLVIFLVVALVTSNLAARPSAKP
jgi:hypothetical protein